jgi:hypothetical protein
MYWIDKNMPSNSSCCIFRRLSMMLRKQKKSDTKKTISFNWRALWLNVFKRRMARTVNCLHGDGAIPLHSAFTLYHAAMQP